MTKRDEWGNNPSVQRMRNVFSRMEMAQKELLEKLNISPFDERLRRARETAKGMFERAWAIAASQGTDMGDEEGAGLYMHCLAWALGQCGVELSADVLPDDDRFAVLVQEVLK